MLPVRSRLRINDKVKQALASTYHRTGKIRTVANATGTRTFNDYESWSGDADLQGHSGRPNLLGRGDQPKGLFEGRFAVTIAR